MSEITRLINAVRQGEPQSSSKLLPIVYEELRRLARARMAEERAGHTLQATALVHEAFLRLVQDEPTGWDGRRHFFAAAAEAMRRILIEHARSRDAIKRGGGRERIELDENFPAIGSPCDQVPDLLALDQALTQLNDEHPAATQLVKLVFFAGLSIEQAAAMLAISRATAYRQWSFARAWLHSAMSDGKNLTSSSPEQ